MKAQTALAEQKRPPAVMLTGAMQHAAVLPVANHDTPAPEGTQMSFSGHNFSQVQIRSAACPASPTRYAFGETCHPCPVQVQPKLKVSQPDDEYEREADRAAGMVMQETEIQTPPNHGRIRGLIPSIVRGRSPTVIQRNGVFTGAMLAEVRRYRARQSYEDFINNAERYGLPVRFLRQVARRYAIRFGSSDAVSRVFNEMTLEEETFRSVESMAPALPYGEASGIRTIYEESVHAYLDLMEDEPRWREFITAGISHYRGAPVSRGRVTSDPARVFNEAAANYAAHRVAGWWSAFEDLSIYIAMSAADPARAQRINETRAFDRIRDNYDRAMRETVFGYSAEGGFLGIGAEQAETTRPMSRDMKAFLDREILEGKIPDHFNQVTGFQRMLREAGVQLSPPSSPRPEVQRKAGLQAAQGADLEDGTSAQEYLSLRRAAGRPLAADTRSTFESRLGHDFSRVRVYTDAGAAESARALNAEAYAVGQDIVFGAGQYQPQSYEGQRLLAHELTHVIQQDGNAKSIQRWKDDVHEQLTQEKDATKELSAEDVAPVAATKEEFIAQLRPYSYSTDWKARRLLWTGPLFLSGATKGEGPDHGEDGDYQSLDKKAARRENVGRQDEYIHESVAYYRQLVSAPAAQQAQGGPRVWRGDGWHAMAAPILGTFTGAVAGAMYGAGLGKWVSEKVGGVGGAILGGLAALAAIPAGFALGAVAGGLGIAGYVSVGKSRPPANAREGVLAALGDACHVAQDRAAHWEGVRGYGHSKPGWNPDDPKQNPGTGTEDFGGYKVAVKNTIEVFEHWKSDARQARRSTSSGGGRPERGR